MSKPIVEVLIGGNEPFPSVDFQVAYRDPDATDGISVCDLCRCPSDIVGGEVRLFIGKNAWAFQPTGTRQIDAVEFKLGQARVGSSGPIMVWNPMNIEQRSMAEVTIANLKSAA